MTWSDIDLDRKLEDFVDRTKKRSEGGLVDLKNTEGLKEETKVRKYNRLPNKGDVVNIGPWVLKIKKISNKGMVLAWIKR